MCVGGVVLWVDSVKKLKVNLFIPPKWFEDSVKKQSLKNKNQKLWHTGRIISAVSTLTVLFIYINISCSFVGTLQKHRNKETFSSSQISCILFLFHAPNNF